jgi:hypothetical protein
VVNTNVIISPLDGLDVPFVNEAPYPRGYFNFEGQGIGNLYLTEQMALRVSNGYNHPYEDFTQAEIRNAWNLVRSKLWRQYRRKTPHIWLSTQHEIMRNLPAARFLMNHTEHYDVSTFDAQVEEARQLNFTEKCMRTLENLFDERAGFPLGYRIPYGLDKAKSEANIGGKLLFLPSALPETGLTYGSDELESPLIYEYLNDEGYITLKSISDEQTAQYGIFLLSPRGYCEIDRIRRGRNVDVKSGFCIRAYIKEFDGFFKGMFAAVQEKTGCHITAVWDIPHNDRIDERILRRIREASIVVLDVDAGRFNVGLEAGYALALGKPIVTIRHTPDPANKPELPFDIKTLNCRDYTHDEQQELTEILIERVRVALEEVRSI